MCLKRCTAGSGNKDLAGIEKKFGERVKIYACKLQRYRNTGRSNKHMQFDLGKFSEVDVSYNILVNEC